MKYKTLSDQDIERQVLASLRSFPLDQFEKGLKSSHMKNVSDEAWQIFITQLENEHVLASLQEVVTNVIGESRAKDLEARLKLIEQFINTDSTEGNEDDK